MSKTAEPGKNKEFLALARARTAFRRLALDFSILQTGIQSLQEDLITIAESLDIQIERGPPMPPVQGRPTEQSATSEKGN